MDADQFRNDSELARINWNESDKEITPFGVTGALSFVGRIQSPSSVPPGQFCTVKRLRWSGPESTSPPPSTGLDADLYIVGNIGPLTMASGDDVMVDFVNDRYVFQEVKEQGPVVSCSDTWVALGFAVGDKFALSDKYGSLLSGPVSIPGVATWCKYAIIGAYANCGLIPSTGLEVVIASIPIRYDMFCSTDSYGNPAVALRALYYIGNGVWDGASDDASPLFYGAYPVICESLGLFGHRPLVACPKLYQVIVSDQLATLDHYPFMYIRGGPLPYSAEMYRYDIAYLPVSDITNPLNLVFQFSNLPKLYDPSDLVTVTGPF